MSTDRPGPEPEPADPTSEPGDADLAGEPTTGSGPGRTYDDETPAAEVEATRGGADAGDADTERATGMAGLDMADPGRHQV